MLTHRPVQLPDLALNAGQLFAERGVMFAKSRHLCAGHALTLPLRDQVALAPGASVLSDLSYQPFLLARQPGQHGVPTVNGQKTTLSQCGIGLSQRAKTFAMEFPFDIKAVFPIRVDVRVACR